MYYIWKYNAGDETRFFSCGIEQFEGWEKLGFNLGHKPTIDFPLPLKYYAVNGMMPEDYPMTGSFFDFLVSKKIASILKAHNIPNINYYESQIVRPDGEILKDYYTINILNIVNCVDMEKSDYLIKDWGFPGSEYYFFNKLVLDETKINEDIKLFLLGEEVVHKVVHQDIKDACEKVGVTGIKFIPVEEYRDI